MAVARFGSALRQARRRRGLSLRGLQALVRYDFTYLGQVERGEKPGSVSLAAVCDEVLRAEGCLVDLFRAGGVGGGSGRAAPDGGYATPGGVIGWPRSVSSNVSITQRVRNESPEAVVSARMREATSGNPPALITDLYSLYHGTYSIDGLVRDALRVLEDNSRRLGAAHGGPSQRLLRERAEAALFAGRLTLFDTWVPVAARGYLVLAADAAVEAGDEALVAAAFGHLAFVSAREHLPSVGAGHLRAARESAERAGVPTLVSWVSAVEAEILGARQPDGGQRALDAADAALDREPAAATPIWFDYYSAARLDGFRGQALLAAGRGTAAREALTRALAGLEPGAVKQQAVLLADLAASYLCGDDPDVEQAVVTALTAADALGRTRYHTAAERLAGLRDRLEPWRATPAVRTLDDVLSDQSLVRDPA